MEKTAMTGRYSNIDYGFSIKLPLGAAIYLGAFGTANHGVVLILGEGRLISAYAEYDLLDGNEDKPCALSASAKGQVKVVSGSAMLGHRAACNLVSATAGNYFQLVEQQG